MKLEMIIRFDREIMPETDYISVGGYEMTFSNGMAQRFDFVNYEEAICEYDPSCIFCEAYDIDDIYTDDPDFFKDFDGTIIDISDFYLSTGDEDDDTKLVPVEIIYFRLINDNDESIPATKDALGRVFE